MKVTKTNRPVILEALQNRLLNECLPIASTRQKNRHDDAIMAMAHAVFVRDQNVRQPSIFPTDTIHEITDAFRLEMYEQIRQEIMRGAPEGWMDPTERETLSTKDDEDVFAEYYSRKRPYDSILREFAF